MRPFLPAGALLAAAVLVAGMVPAAAQASDAHPLRVASDGPVTFTMIVNNRRAFPYPGIYFGNVMVRAAATPANATGVHAFTIFSDGNRAGDSNTLSGVPAADGSQSSFVPRNTPLVINLNIRTIGGPHDWASISTPDPTNLTANWVTPPDYSPNQPLAAIRQVSRGIVDIGFAPRPVRHFPDHPVIVRVTNVCRG